MLLDHVHPAEKPAGDVPTRHSDGLLHGRALPAATRATLGRPTAAASAQDRIPATVTAVVDGDTIKVRNDAGGAFTVRLIGTDTPETKHPSKPVQCFGVEASTKTD